MNTDDLRAAIYRSFARTGLKPNYDELAQRFKVTRGQIVEGIRRLAVERHLVIDESDEILMAHPFSAIPLGFSVMGAKTIWWGGCSWDSFAIPHLVSDESIVLVATTCPGCSRPGAWVVNREEPPPSDWLAHFLVPAARMWDNVVFTCSNQRLFCGHRCIEDWLERNSYQQGYVMDISTLWRLASRWYEGRLETGYTRREPAAARDYLRGAGLHDPFWGTGE